MPQPVLHTARLTLVPLEDSHLDDEVALDADPEVMRYLTGRARTRAEVEAQHRVRMARAQPVDGLGFWSGFVAGAFVGWWILAPDEGDDAVVEPGRAELGYRLHRAWWRQGLASEGSRELLRYAFDDLGLDAVHAETMAVNAGSRAVMAAVGLRHVRTFDGDDPDPLPGADRGEVEYAVTRDQWRSDHPD